GPVSYEGNMSLAPILIWIVIVYAGLTIAVAALVLDVTSLVVAGVILVGSGWALANLVAKAMGRSASTRLNVYEKGAQCDSLHPSTRPLVPPAKNSASPDGSKSTRTASMHSPTQPATTNGSTSMPSGREAKVLTAQPLSTVS